MDNIEALLKERGLTKTAFSDLLGVKTIKRFASVLGVETWQLFASPSEVQKETDGGYKCPNCGYPLKIKVE